MTQINLKYNLTNCRKRLKLTQEEMANKLGIKRATYASYEEGRAEPSIATYFNICEILDISDIKGFYTKHNFFNSL